jgi:hypothetical protein
MHGGGPGLDGRIPPTGRSEDSPHPIPAQMGALGTGPGGLGGKLGLPPQTSPMQGVPGEVPAPEGAIGSSRSPQLNPAHIGGPAGALGAGVIAGVRSPQPRPAQWTAGFTGSIGG